MTRAALLLAAAAIVVLSWGIGLLVGATIGRHRADTVTVTVPHVPCLVGSSIGPVVIVNGVQKTFPKAVVTHYPRGCTP